jgi:hypothetical protein
MKLEQIREIAAKLQQIAAVPVDGNYVFILDQSRMDSALRGVTHELPGGITVAEIIERISNVGKSSEADGYA